MEKTKKNKTRRNGLFDRIMRRVNRDIIEQIEQLRNELLVNTNRSAAFVMQAVYSRGAHDPLAAFNNGDDPVIPIVFICDTRYVMPTCVAISSLFSNKRSSSNYRVFVIGESLTDSDTAMLRESGCAVEVIEAADHYRRFAHTHPFVSAAALQKFDLPQTMAQWDKILYIDSDTLILRDVRKLYDTDLQDRYAAVVKDFLGMERGHHTRIGHEAYFNSGVMLLNLAKMREEALTETLVTLKQNDPWNMFMDQDAFNCAFRENVVYLPPENNLMYANNLTSGKGISEIAAFYGISDAAMRTSTEHPVVLHLSSPQKPWNTALAEGYLDYRKYSTINEIYRTR